MHECAQHIRFGPAVPRHSDSNAVIFVVGETAQDRWFQLPLPSNLPANRGIWVACERLKHDSRNRFVVGYPLPHLWMGLDNP